ncbi:sigma-70 family RNA polymerase sigma factor [Erythrobacter dokdonensis]|uniref:RNA polymerase sigma factor n=1 Tax=Erythrobacter dokdonensis DSW-74 TaxID=1300349 RepID=A0A1A7BHC8_9SPHN|nr:sigma-70 family RNA polymerase sigma factor [Erythrobacter dokdonensis]OBV11884.1 RNA polymerase sigma factor [Erythrobacter dokdonensis DSW-74]
MTASGEPSSPASRADDAALVARLAARDPVALREVIAGYAGQLNRIAYRMVGNPHEAEDIVQEAMLRLWDHAPRLAARHPAGTPAGGALRLSGWLGRVTTNLAIDKLRLARRVSGEEVPERADEAPLADAMIEADERDGATRALVLALPERQRAAIVLTYYEDLPNAEAAEAMDMNIKAFESLLHRARAALRQAFEGQGEAR